MLRLTLRNLMAHKVRLLMSTLAIVLGIGFLSGVLTFNNGMQTTFDSIIKGSTADGLVRAEGAESFSDGSTGVSTATLAPDVVDRLAELPEVREAHGNIDGYGLFVLDSDGKLVGGQGAPTIAFNYTDSENVLGEPTLELVSGEWPEGDDEVVLDTRSAENAEYEIGDEVRMVAPSGELNRTARLVGTAEFNGGGTAGATLVIFSTSGAQQLFLGGQDVFTSVSLTAADGVSQEELAAVARGVVPDGFTAVTGDTVVEESQTAVGEFLGVVKTFLLVFALIAIVVGAFIIVNTFSILVAQRVRELALVRALGAARAQVTGSVLIEALVMSLVAAVVGIVGGWLLALGLAALFNAIGLSINSDALDVTGATIATCVTVAVVVTMVSAYVPARRASRIPPVAAMREEAAFTSKSMGRRTLYGAIALIIGAGLAVAGLMGAPGNDAAWIGAGALIWIITAAVISPVIGRPVLVGCRALFSRLFGTPGRLAGENALRDPRRTGATASALMIGLALVSTIGVLAASLNKSVEDIVDESFASDFLVQSPTFQAFPTSIAEQMREVDGVELVSEQQGVNAKLKGEDAWVTTTDDAFHEIYELDVTAGTQRIKGRQTLVSTDVARDNDLRVGSTLTLTFPSGPPQKLTVAGIFESDGYVTSNINVPTEVIEQAGIKRMDHSVSITVADGVDTAEVKESLEKVVEDIPIVPVQDRDEFADSIRGQIDQLLYIIYGLLALAIVIAVIGIVNTLGLSVLERTREIGLLRAVGLSRRGLRRMVRLESVAIALLGAVLGMVLGLTFGSLLRYALREQMTSLALPTGQLLAFLVVAVIVGVIAAIVPAIRASRMNVLDAITTE